MRKERKTSMDIKNAIKQLTEKHTDGGEITLDAFCKLVPDAPRVDVVKALKSDSNGLFIAGRRGHETRWAYGKKAKEIAQNSPKPKKTKGKPSGSRQPTTESTTIGFGLKIGVGGQTQTIPMSVEVVTAGS